MKRTINNRFDLAQYCLKKLGAPIIRINITEEQIDERIDDAVDMFMRFHMDGSYQQVYVHHLTQEDIDNKKIKVPNNLMSVVGVYLTSDPGINSLTSGNNLQIQSYFSDVISRSYGSGGSNGLSNYTISQSYFGTMQSQLPGVTRVHTHKMFKGELIVPDIKWDKVAVGHKVGIDCFWADDPDEFGQIYNDYWLKQYSTALIKLQWATNIGKFQGIALPGGGTLNGDTLYQQAVQEISELELKLQNQFSLPISPFMA